MLTFFNMPHLSSMARIPQFLIKPRHQPFIFIPSSHSQLLSQVAGAAENCNHQPSSTKNQKPPPCPIFFFKLPIYLYIYFSIYLPPLSSPLLVYPSMPKTATLSSKPEALLFSPSQLICYPFILQALPAVVPSTYPSSMQLPSSPIHRAASFLYFITHRPRE
jgi:hypothetical protein